MMSADGAQKWILSVDDLKKVVDRHLWRLGVDPLHELAVCPASRLGRNVAKDHVEQRSIFRAIGRHQQLDAVPARVLEFLFGEIVQELEKPDAERRSILFAQVPGKFVECVNVLDMLRYDRLVDRATDDDGIRIEHSKITLADFSRGRSSHWQVRPVARQPAVNGD